MIREMRGGWLRATGGHTEKGAGAELWWGLEEELGRMGSFEVSGRGSVGPRTETRVPVPSPSAGYRCMRGRGTERVGGKEVRRHCLD